MRVLFILVLHFLFIAAKAQQGPTISGRVAAAEKIAATVSLVRATDSSIVKSTITKEAAFAFENTAAGQYLLVVTATGYRKIISPLIDLKSVSIQVPDIQLQPQAQSLEGVTVTAKRPMIEQKI